MTVIPQGRPPVMMDDTAQAACAADSSSSFAMALNVAEVMENAQVNTVQPIAVEEGEGGSKENVPNAALSLVAAMVAFSPQQIPIYAGDAPEVVDATRVNSGQQQAVPSAVISQQPQVDYTRILPKGHANQENGEQKVQANEANEQSMQAADHTSVVYQKPLQPFVDSNVIQAAEQNAKEDFSQSITGKDAVIKEESADLVRKTGTVSSAHLGNRPLKEKVADEPPPLAPAAATVIAHRAEYVQQSQDVQAAQDVAPDRMDREEHAALQVARATISAIKRGVTEYKLRLRPEGLGQVDVTISTKGREISLSMKTQNEEAQGLILGHADELRAELRTQNYQINGLTVEVGMDNQGGEYLAFGQQKRYAFEQDQAVYAKEHEQREELPAVSAKVPQPASRSSTINYKV